MKYCIKTTTKFRKDVKRLERRGYRLASMTKAIDLLAAGDALPEKYRDHALTGDFEGFRECHISPDWLLVYQIDGEDLILLLSRTGTHSDLF